MAENDESWNRVDYDAAGRATQIQTKLGAMTYTQTITSDQQGRRTNMQLTWPGGARSIGHTYSARGQLETLRDLNGGTTTFAYNDDGQETSRTLPTGLVVSQDYPSTHVTSGVSYSATLLDQRLRRGYHQNANGMVDVRRKLSIEGSTVSEVVRRYFYDRRGWLTDYVDEVYTPSTSGTSDSCTSTSIKDENNGACVPPPGSGSQVVPGKHYDYDAVGNRSGSGIVLDAAGGNRLTGFDGFSMTYDDEGNLTRKSKSGVDDVQPTWNSLGQLTSVTRLNRGTVWDSVAGMYYVRARWYDPRQGRFISEDPIGLAGGINPYRYAGNDPVNKVNPSGLCELWAKFVIREAGGEVWPRS